MEAARRMRSHAQHDNQRIERLAKYMNAAPGKTVQLFRWEYEDQRVVLVFTDANWAECQATRRTTSGSVVMRGLHLLKSSSSTQRTLARQASQSSARATDGEMEALGMVHLAKNLGDNLEVNIKIDAKSTMGTLHRKESGRLKHVDTNALWQQEKVASGEVTLDMIPRECNMADIMTHELPCSEILKHMTAMGSKTQERKPDPKNVGRQREHVAWLNTRERMQCDSSLQPVRTVEAEGR